MYTSGQQIIANHVVSAIVSDGRAARQ